MKNASRVAPLTELALIERIRRQAAAAQSRGNTLQLGIGDDCAILRPPTNSDILVTTDLSLEGRHFLLRIHPPESIGHRALARGLSDLAAMGATPLAAFLSLALPAGLPATAKGRAWIDRFFRGLHALGDRFHVPLAGGDTSESPRTSASSGPVLADIVLIGAAPRGQALRRSGSSPGDLLYVTGRLGGAAAELAALLARRRPASISNPDAHPHLFPIPRLDTGRALVRRRLASACIDLSDGLSTDLAHLCRASSLRAELLQSALPIHPLAAKLGPSRALHAALHGGEDYELLFSAPPSVNIPSSLSGVPITRIGRLTRKRSSAPLLTLIQPDGTRTPLEPAGWEHFTHP